MLYYSNNKWLLLTVKHSHIETCFVIWYYYIEILTKDEMLYKGAFNMKLLYRVIWAIKIFKMVTKYCTDRQISNFIRQ